MNAKAPPIAKPRARKPSKLDDYKDYIQSRLSKYPLTAARVYREIQQMGFTGKYTIVRDLRPVDPAQDRCSGRPECEDLTLSRADRGCAVGLFSQHHGVQDHSRRYRLPPHSAH
ncbi:hypothetical protein [Methanoculleus sp.]|uniref:hypothetical protein n=1 Tax=Methanoculleus sp. TaxID=90427 RepID=UPI0026093AAE|nr:hypothetical protein [Methanoculleus sp.]MDI6867196.1 hypothetical protein [Methanoculleus sp.]